LISERLENETTCPLVGRHGLPASGPALERLDDGRLRCTVCDNIYPGEREGYLDLMPPQEGAHTSLYVSHEEEFEAALDYKRISIPLLGAGVRQRAIRRMLRPCPTDRLIELGCGNAKFVYWNRKQVTWAVGIDPAPLFAREALDQVDLCRADARALPFRDGEFTAAMSIDVLEHLPLPDFKAYLGEAHRVLAPGGRIFVFSNTREGSRLDFIVRSARRLSRWLGDRGIIDDTRDRLRKSDHVKAVTTYPQLQDVFRECGFEIEQVVFWNGLFQSLIENLVMKLAESFLRRQKAESGRQQSKTDDSAIRNPQSAIDSDRLRSSVKQTLARRGLAYRAMMMLTNLMWLDLVLFGKWQAGPYFVLARRVES